MTVSVPVRATEVRRRRAVAAARAAAAPSMAEIGLPANVAEEWHRPGEVGVSWTVVVGEVHRTAGERDPYWVWTARWRHWRDALASVVSR
jgi:hypothetical protein